MKINETAINFAKLAAEKAYYAAIADQYIPEKGLAHDLLQNLVWACDKNHNENFYAASDEFEYDYYLEVSGNICLIREIKNSTGYQENIEIRCDTIENAADSLKYLYC